MLDIALARMFPTCARSSPRPVVLFPFRDLHPSIMCRNMPFGCFENHTTPHHHAKVKETEGTHQGQCSMPALQANFQEGKLVGGWLCPQPRFVCASEPRIKDFMLRILQSEWAFSPCLGQVRFLIITTFWRSHTQWNHAIPPIPSSSHTPRFWSHWCCQHLVSIPNWPKYIQSDGIPEEW